MSLATLFQEEINKTHIVEYQINIRLIFAVCVFKSFLTRLIFLHLGDRSTTELHLKKMGRFELPTNHDYYVNNLLLESL